MQKLEFHLRGDRAVALALTALTVAGTVGSAHAAGKAIPITKSIKAAFEGNTDDVTLDFVAADINDVLKALAVQTHANIVSGSDVKGTVTVSLAHVTLEDALDLVSKLSGYQYAKIGRTYVVGSPTSIATLTASGTAAAPPTTVVLGFNYSDPADLTATIKERYPNVKATPGKASGGGQGAGGVLIVTGTDADVDAVRHLVTDAEAALSRGIAASRTTVYKIKYSNADDLETVLSRLVPGIIVTPGPSQGFALKAPSTADASGATSTTASYGAGGAAAVVSTTGNQPTKASTPSLLLTGTDADIQRSEAILDQIDVKPAQITYEAKITEINLDDSKKIGLNWDFSGATTRIGETPDNVAGAKPTLGDNGYLGKVFKFGMFGRTAISSLANVSLDALFTTGDAKLLSNPNIAALDGQPAAVFIGDAVRYVSSITQTPTGPSVTTDTVNVGIKLYVTGKISNDGYVTMNIHPEVSTITGYLSVPGGGSLPQVASREATTTVRVKDGDTLAIGGLINENDIKNVNKVPFFGDLPFFGNLFRDTKHSHHRNEIVIFVKVSVQKDS